MSYESVQILLVGGCDSCTAATLEAMQGGCRLTNPIHVVRDGAEALDFLFCAGRYANRPAYDLPRLVLLESRLTTAGGVDVLHTMRRDERAKSISVVVLTSSAEEGRSCSQLGADGFLERPVTLEALQNVVREMNQRPIDQETLTGAPKAGSLSWLVVSAPSCL